VADEATHGEQGRPGHARRRPDRGAAQAP
jgi:hypothetical protein